MRYHERMIMLRRDRRAVERHLLNHGPPEGRHQPAGYGQKDPLVEYKRESFEMLKR